MGLGPVVASLSLGSPAFFEFRKIDRAPRESGCLRFILHHVREPARSEDEQAD